MSIVNLWSLGHFIQWSFLGRFVFTNWYLFIFLSVGWELLELVLPFEFAVESWENKISDIAVNTLGFYLGSSIRK
tara:strand:+ start:223 stop:447 length:225 start_codon:yes stop_codon:yes gene_type:complete